MKQKSTYPVSVSRCPSCLKEGFSSYCRNCLTKLFDGKRVSHVLPFSRPDYNKRKRELSGERISISGLQTKHSLKLEASTLALTEHGGQYILKPITNADFSNPESVPANEHVTMHLAREVFQITTAECALIFFPDGAPAYLTRRFDVIPDGGKVPQEDFAQIAGKSEEKGGPNYKYDFSYEELGELMREFVKAYKIEADRFFRIVLFNYLVCNGDAHLKNFSLFRSEDYGDYLLTPAYDLVSTKLHLGTERDTALELFKGDYETAGYKINGKHCKDDFVEFGLRLGLGDERIAKVFEEFTDKKLPLMDDLIDRSFLSDVLKSAYKQNVRDRIKRLIYSYQEEEENDRGKARR